MKLLLLLYLILALAIEPVRRAPAVLFDRFAHALALWAVLGKRWRVAWHQASRRSPW